MGSAICSAVTNVSNSTVHSVVTAEIRVQPVIVVLPNLGNGAMVANFSVSSTSSVSVFHVSIISVVKIGNLHAN